MPSWIRGAPCRLLFAVFLSLLTGVSAAQEKDFQVNRLSAAPVIDGRIGDSEWNAAVRVSDLHQVRPVEFTTPSERTVWYIGYDDKALYVAAHAYDSDPSEISAQKLRQGSSLDSDDIMTVLIDAFNNKRSGYAFTLNPNGVRAEAIYATATKPSDQWDGIWRGAAMIVDDGWTMEMAIPFNTITFDPANDTWGINFSRKIRRKAEDISWQSRSGEVNPTVSGEVSGFTGLSQGLGLDVIPSASSTYTNDREANTTDADFNPSLDINYKLTPSVSGLLTFNTDFAATEVDGRQLDLQRFSLFFPEKRSFFLTDFDIFQFGGVSTGTGFGSGTIGVKSGNNGLAFFSRTVGLTSDRKPVDIIGGTKISGRIGDVDFGALYIHQDEYIVVDDDTGAEEFVDASDLMVGRVSTGVLEESSLGAIATFGDPGSSADSSLAGVDFLYRNTRIGANRSMQGDFWLQKTDNEGASEDDLAWSASISFPARLGFEGGFQVQEVGANFDPKMGFANRTGVRLYGGEFSHRRNRPGDVFVRTISHGIGLTRWEYLDTGFVQSQELDLELFGSQSSEGDFMVVRYKFLKERLLIGEQPLEDIGILIPPGEYSFERVRAAIFTADHRKIWVGTRVSTGDFFNGDLLTIEPEISWTPSDHLNFVLSYSYSKYDFPGQSATTRQISLQNVISFNSRLSLVTLAQYDNISEDLGINSRLRYNLSAGQDIWFVINHNMLRDPLDDRFRSTQTVAAAKIRYTFRY
jgi:hypothetical protein